MKRKEILPKWIRFFSWIFLILLITPLIFIMGIFGNASFSMFGLKCYGTSLQPIAIWNTFIATLAGTVAYGILWGKDWAIKLGIIYAYLAILTCCIAVAMALASGNIYIPLEPLFLIPFMVILNKNKEKWSKFNTRIKDDISNQGMDLTR